MELRFSRERFDLLPVIGILRRFEPRLVREIAAVAAEAGLTNLEVTMNTPDAADQIASLVELAGGRMNVGAGTVTSVEQMEEALSAGAGFIVTPVVVPEIIQACRERGIAVFPGALSPTEIHRAWTLGAHMVKLFPAAAMGPRYVREIKAPLSDVKILATGGIGLENAADYIEAGADGFGVGGGLFKAERMLARDWDWLKDRLDGFKRLFANHSA